MKKVVLLLLIFILISGAVFSADLTTYPQCLEAGDIIFDAGLGLAYTGYLNGGSSMSIPPLFAIAEYCLPVELPISVGATFAIFQHKWKGRLVNNDDIYTLKYTTIFAGIRGNYHFNIDVDALDLYAGLTIGYRNVSTKYNPKPPASLGWVERELSTILAGAQVGARYYFTSTIGAMAEIGYPYIIKGGIALKF